MNLIAAFAVAAALAADFYVAPSGSDSGPGSKERPFATVQRGVDAAVEPGDSVFLREGEYRSGTAVVLRRSGAPGRPITLANYPGERPVLRFTEPSKGAYPRLEIQAEARGAAPIGWLVVRGLEITGGVDGVKFYNAHDLTISGNDIHDNREQGILGSGGVRVTISSNTIRRNGDFSAFRRDPSVGNKLHGLYGTGSDYRVRGNVFVSNLAFGLQAAGYPFDPEHYAGPEYAGADRWLIEGNTFAFQKNRGGVVVWLEGARRATIRGNVFYQNARLAPREAQGVSFEHAGPGSVVAGNVFFATPPGGTEPLSDTARGGSYSARDNRFDVDPRLSEDAP